MERLLLSRFESGLYSWMRNGEGSLGREVHLTVTVLLVNLHPHTGGGVGGQWAAWRRPGARGPHQVIAPLGSKMEMVARAPEARARAAQARGKSMLCGIAGSQVEQDASEGDWGVEVRCGRKNGDRGRRGVSFCPEAAPISLCSVDVDERMVLWSNERSSKTPPSLLARMRKRCERRSGTRGERRAGHRAKGLALGVVRQVE